mgnify:CR=1 FL=1
MTTKTVRKVNPRIVYGSISGFGQDGPYHKRPGFDQIAQGMGGLMSVTGAPGEGPMRVGIPVADLTAGLFCALGILTALLERDVSGEGQWVQTSLLQAQIFMLDFQAARWLMEKEVAKQAGNNHPTSIPTGVFKTADGHFNIATTGQAIWERCVKAIGADQVWNRSTPIRGQVVREYLPWQHILSYCEAILRIYNRFGRRDNAYKARIKILVKAEGQRFVDAVSAEFAALQNDDAQAGAHVIPQAELDRVAAHFTAPPVLAPGFASSTDVDAPPAYRRRDRR